jgi:hypothetical protein
MTDIKPIETEYNGFRFRSRLEARWAVFFDTLEIEYRYEPEGFDLDGEWYLPDFWVPEWECWVEIKPDIPKFMPFGKPVEKREYRLCEKLAGLTQKPALLIGGQPWVKPIPSNIVFGETEYGIAIFCHDMIPQFSEGSPNGVISHLPFSDYLALSPLSEGFFCLSHRLYGFIYQTYMESPELFGGLPLPCRGDAKSLIEADKVYFQNKYGQEHPKWHYGVASDRYLFSGGDKLYLEFHFSSSPLRPSGKLLQAFKDARQARF